VQAGRLCGTSDVTSADLRPDLLLSVAATPLEQESESVHAASGGGRKERHGGGRGGKAWKGTSERQ